MTVRGIRGAITVTENQSDLILSATRELLQVIMESNPALRPEDLASAFFTVTNDLNAVHPARAARQIGWTNIPLMCATEIPVPSSLQLCIRVLLHWNTSLHQEAIQHIYLREAKKLRPDLSRNSNFEATSSGEEIR